MSYTEKEFANCVFNPLTKGKMIKNFPKLNEILDAEDKTQPYIDRLLRYIIALNDSNSPLVHQEKEWSIRKQAAIEVGNFHPENEAVEIERLLKNKDERAIKISTLYLRKFVKHRIWAMMVSSEVAFWAATEKLMSQHNESKTDSIAQIQVQNETNERLEKLEKQFFGENEDLIKANKKTGFRPEDMATKV